MKACYIGFYGCLGRQVKLTLALLYLGYLSFDATKFMLHEHLQRINYKYEPFGLGRLATGTYSQRLLRGLLFVCTRPLCGLACIMYCNIFKKYPCMQIFSFLALLVFPINSEQTHKHTHTKIQQSSFNSRSPSVSVASRQKITHKDRFAAFCSFVLGRSAAWLVLCIIILAPRFQLHVWYYIISYRKSCSLC